MPGVTPFRQDDVQHARAWAAFVADDVRATAPPSLEARVLLAAQAAMANRPCVDPDRRRRRWMATVAAVAASLLAAAAYCLAPTAPDAPRTASAPSPATSAVATAAATTAPGDLADAPGRPLPMTNIEAGRLLATPPARLLAARPLFDAPGTGLVRIGGLPRGRSFNAPTVEPTGTRPQATPDHAVAAPALAAAPVVPPAPPPATAPEAWTARGLRNVFDPAAGEPTDKAAPAPVLLEHAAPLPPKDAPPAPPK